MRKSIIKTISAAAFAAVVCVATNQVKAQAIQAKETSNWSKSGQQKKPGYSLLKLKVNGCDTCSFSLQSLGGEETIFPVEPKLLKDTLYISMPNKRLMFQVNCIGKSSRFYNITKADKMETMIVDFKPKNITDSTVNN